MSDDKSNRALPDIVFTNITEFTKLTIEELYKLSKQVKKDGKV